METNIKLLITYFAVSQIMAELTDSLKGTKIYRQKNKNILNQVDKIVSGEIEALCKQFKHQSDEMQYHAYVRIIADNFVNCVKKKDLKTLGAILEAYHNGEIGIIDDQKHSKITKQLERI